MDKYIFLPTSKFLWTLDKMKIIPKQQYGMQGEVMIATYLMVDLEHN